MSESILNQFLSLLLSANLNKSVFGYYDDNVQVSLNEDVKIREKKIGIQLLQQILRGIQILQFKVEAVKRTGNLLSYEIYTITRNEDSTLNFSKHQIENIWDNNRICQHRHTIINF